MAKKTPEQPKTPEHKHTESNSVNEGLTVNVYCNCGHLVRSYPAA